MHRVAVTLSSQYTQLPRHQREGVWLHVSCAVTVAQKHQGTEAQHGTLMHSSLYGRQRAREPLYPSKLYALNRNI